MYAIPLKMAYVIKSPNLIVHQMKHIRLNVMKQKYG